MNQEITKEQILERINKLKVNGLIVQNVGDKNYHQGKNQVEWALNAQVRMTDPTINSRVSVTLDLHKLDNEQTLTYKLGIAESLLSEALLINTHKEEEEKAFEKLQSAVQTAKQEMIELKKKSPVMFEYLIYNLDLVPHSVTDMQMSPIFSPIVEGDN